MKHIVAIGTILKTTSTFKKGERIEIFLSDDKETVEVVIKKSLFLSHDELQQLIMKGQIFLVESE